jgi:ABC-type transporter Mla subunit MlaD
MGANATFLRVGLLIVVTIAALVGLVIFLGGERYSKGPEFESYFRESVQGLEVGAPVKYRGVTLGRVTEIGLVSAEYGRGQPAQIERATFRLVFVRFVIDPKRVGRLPDTQMAVQTGLRARVASQGITGLAYIELDFVNPDTYPPQEVPWTPLAEYIPSMPSTLTQVQDAAQDLLAKLNSVDIAGFLAESSGLINDLRQELRDGDAHRALASVEELLKTVQETVTATDLPGLSADLRATSGAARGLIQSRDTRALIANAAAAAERLSQVAAKLPPLIASLQNTSDRAGSGVADLQRSLGPLLRDAETAVGNLRETTEELRQYPASVLFGGPPPRPRTPAR